MVALALLAFYCGGFLGVLVLLTVKAFSTREHRREQHKRKGIKPPDLDGQ